MFEFIFFWEFHSAHPTCNLKLGPDKKISFYFQSLSPSSKSFRLHTCILWIFHCFLFLLFLSSLMFWLRLDLRLYLFFQICILTDQNLYFTSNFYLFGRTNFEVSFEILKFDHLLGPLKNLFSQISHKLRQINCYQSIYFSLWTFDNNQIYCFKDLILTRATCYIPKRRLSIQNFRIEIEIL